MTRTRTLPEDLTDADVRDLLQGHPGKSEPEEVVIVLEGYRPKSWNTFYAGKHFSSRQEHVQDAQRAVLAALAVHPVAPFTVPVSVTVIAYYKGQMTDPDNVCSKLLIDGLKHAGIVVDDTPQYIRSVTTISRKDNQRPRAEIILTATTPPASRVTNGKETAE